MKRIIPLLTLIILSGCSRIPDGYTVHRGQGFSIAAPADWDVQAGEGDVALILSAPQPVERLNTQKPTVTVSFGDNAGAEGSLVDRVEDALVKAIPGFRMLRRETYLLSRYDARLVFRGDLGSVPVVWDMRLSEGDPDYYVSALSGEEEYAALKGEFEKIAGTFRRRKK
jgi:hypothetical protein